MTTKAPPFDCHQCGRRIGARRVHWVLGARADPRVCCTRCIEASAGWDAVAFAGTRAGVAAELGLWPARYGLACAPGGTPQQTPPARCATCDQPMGVVEPGQISHPMCQGEAE